MKRSALLPYGIIAVLGIFGMIVLGGVGLSQNEHAEGAGQEAEVDLNPESIYNNNCMICHGGDLTGGMGPSLINLGEKYSFEEVADIINNGIDGTAMTGDYANKEQAEVLADWLLNEHSN